MLLRAPLVLLLLVCCFCSVSLTKPPPCIPVLGFGLMKDVNNFTQRLITHIDTGSGSGSGDGTNATSASASVSVSVASFKDRVHSWVNRSRVIRNVTFIDVPHALIGVAETWNLIITSFPSAPWYAICAYDITFRAGQLQEFSRRFWAESGLLYSKRKTTVNFAHTKWENLPGNRGFNFFALTREVVAGVGLFDENIFPAFWEDRDFQHRLALWPGARVRTFKNIRLWHGVDVSAAERERYLDLQREEEEEAAAEAAAAAEEEGEEQEEGEEEGKEEEDAREPGAGKRSGSKKYNRNNRHKNLKDYSTRSGSSGSRSGVSGNSKVSSSPPSLSATNTNTNTSTTRFPPPSSSPSSPSPRKFNYTSGTVYLGRPWVRTMQRASQLSMAYLMQKWRCNSTLTLRHHHLLHCLHTRPFGDPGHGLDYWRLNASAVQSVRDFYVQAEAGGGGGDEEEEASFRMSLSDSLDSKFRGRRKAKYSFEDVKKYHHSRRKKVIMARKKEKKKKKNGQGDGGGGRAG